MSRSVEAIRRHYEIEKALADRLRGSTRDERRVLYSEVYDELFRRVPDHPQLERKETPHERELAAGERFAFLSRFLSRDVVFLEIGAGDGALCRRVAGSVKRAVALDVSREILDGVGGEVETVLSDGCSIPLELGTVDVAYSYQVMEHIHPDDALDQLKNIYAALATGGRYVCVTPNRLNGPHDVSKYFDENATGFHLHEYTVYELSALFESVGFRRIEAYVGLRHHYFRVPVVALNAVERGLECLPFALRSWLGKQWGIRNLLFVSLCATK